MHVSFRKTLVRQKKARAKAFLLRLHRRSRAAYSSLKISKSQTGSLITTSRHT